MKDSLRGELRLLYLNYIITTTNTLATYRGVQIEWDTYLVGQSRGRFRVAFGNQLLGTLDTEFKWILKDMLDELSEQQSDYYIHYGKHRPTQELP